MPGRYFTRLSLVALIGIALALGGCGNSKKGGGSGYILPLHSALSVSHTTHMQR